MSEEEIFKRAFTSNGKYNVNFEKTIIADEIELVDSWYSDSSSVKESVIRKKLNIEVHPKCPYCGRPVKIIPISRGYFSHVCDDKKCESKLRTENAAKTNMQKYGHKWANNVQKTKETKLKKYGNSTFTNRDKANKTNQLRYGGNAPICSDEVKRKIKDTCLERFGCENPYQNKLVVEKIQRKRKLKQDAISEKLRDGWKKNREKWSERIQNACLEKFGVNCCFKVPEIFQKTCETRIKKYGALCNIKKYQETCLEKYGVNNWAKSDVGKKRLLEIANDPKIQYKKYLTKKKNHTFNTSKPEEKTFEILKERYPNVTQQYKSEKYPWYCDFYIPSLDCYIELQGHWTHGGHPYDEEKDKEKIEEWKSKHTKFYDNAIETWAIRDVEKRKVAKKNNLRYIEIFSCREKEIIQKLKDEKILD